MDTVKQLIETKGDDVWSVGPDDTVYAAIEVMAEKNAGALAVVDQDRLVGMLSERDYTRKIILQGKSSKDTLVREIMTFRVIYARPEQTIDDCMAIMNENGFRHMPVVKDDELVGMLSLKDLVNEVIKRQQTTIRELETYIMG